MKKCKCGGVPIYRNGELQICAKCLWNIWIGKITLEEYLRQ